MNLENVKYPWMIAKYKGAIWEIEMKNCEMLPDTEMIALHAKAIKHLQIIKGRAVRTRDAEIRAQSSEIESQS